MTISVTCSAMSTPSRRMACLSASSRTMSRTPAPKILTVPNVGKINLIGAQDEVIFLEFSTREIAALGISQQDVVRTLQAQNAITPSGVIERVRNGSISA